MKLSSKIVAMISISALASIVAGCNTVKGLGQDVEAGGEKLQQTAQTQKVKAQPRTANTHRTTTTKTTYHTTQQ